MDRKTLRETLKDILCRRCEIEGCVDCPADEILALPTIAAALAVLDLSKRYVFRDFKHLTEQEVVHLDINWRDDTVVVSTEEGMSYLLSFGSRGINWDIAPKQETNSPPGSKAEGQEEGGIVDREELMEEVVTTLRQREILDCNNNCRLREECLSKGSRFLCCELMAKEILALPTIAAALQALEVVRECQPELQDANVRLGEILDNLGPVLEVWKMYQTGRLVRLHPDQSLPKYARWQRELLRNEGFRRVEAEKGCEE